MGQESLALNRQANDVLGIVRSLLLMGHVSDFDHEKARAFYKEAEVLSRELGSASLQSHFLNRLGINFLFEGDLDRAAAYLEETSSPLGSSKTQTSLVPTPGKVLGQFFSARAHTMIE